MQSKQSISYGICRDWALLKLIDWFTATHAYDSCSFLVVDNLKDVQESKYVRMPLGGKCSILNRSKKTHSM